MANIIDQTSRIDPEALVNEGEPPEGGEHKCSDYLVTWAALLSDLIGDLKESDKLSPVYITVAAPNYN